MQNDFMDIMNRLSENARLALQKADKFAKIYGKGYMGTEHLLLGLLDQDNSTACRLLTLNGVSLDDVKTAVGPETAEYRPAEIAMMSLSESAILTLRMANNLAREYEVNVIGSEHLLFALISQPTSRAAVILEKLHVDLDQFADKLETYLSKEVDLVKQRQKKAKFTGRPKKFLTRFATDLTEMARQNHLDKVIGRENEIERVITVLCRRTKSNPVLIGEAGVGKTAIVEGLAAKIAKNDVPANLIGKHIYEVDLTAMIAGTKFRGEFEERIKGLVDEAVGDPDCLLFIDELHNLTGAGAGEGSLDAANIIKPALARGQICLIGATTADEYRKNIEKDHALARRFQTVYVEEPSELNTFRILKGIKAHYESHHHVKIPDNILKTAINMSVRYINDRYLPDKVIDIIDEAAAIAKVAAGRQGGDQFRKLKITATELSAKVAEAAGNEDFEAAAKFKTELARAEKELKKLQKSGVSDKIPTLTEAHLAKAVSLKTGIPVAKVHGSELKLLSKLEDHIDRAIIGQNEAVHAVARAIRRGRSGIGDPRRPIGSFLFMGPTGVGKTELARVVAREVFGGENSLIKIDMSEFGEKHTASRLTGTTAGYIGYEDGGKLTEQVRHRPYSVVLFDEIEKAHPDVFNLLLQILEDGVLTDGHGNMIRFNNTIIILTSNLGSSVFGDDKDTFGFASSKISAKSRAAAYEAQKTAALRALKRAMRPELINRLDAVLVFHPLTAPQVTQIFHLMLEDLKKRLGAKSIGLQLSPAAEQFIIKLGFDPKHGARPMRRAIEDQLESLLSDAIIKDQLKKGDIAKIDLKKQKLQLSVARETTIKPAKKSAQSTIKKSAKPTEKRLNHEAKIH